MALQGMCICAVVKINPNELWIQFQSKFIQQHKRSSRYFGSKNEQFRSMFNRFAGIANHNGCDNSSKNRELLLHGWGVLRRCVANICPAKICHGIRYHGFDWKVSSVSERNDRCDTVEPGAIDDATEIDNLRSVVWRKSLQCGNAWNDGRQLDGIGWNYRIAEIHQTTDQCCVLWWWLCCCQRRIGWNDIETSECIFDVHCLTLSKLIHLQQVHLIDLKSKKIKILPPMKTGRCEHASIVYNNCLYAAGGMKSGVHLDSVEK